MKPNAEAENSSHSTTYPSSSNEASITAKSLPLWLVGDFSSLSTFSNSANLGLLPSIIGELEELEHSLGIGQSRSKGEGEAAPRVSLPLGTRAWRERAFTLNTDGFGSHMRMTAATPAAGAAQRQLMRARARIFEVHNSGGNGDGGGKRKKRGHLGLFARKNPPGDNCRALLGRPTYGVEPSERMLDALDGFTFNKGTEDSDRIHFVLRAPQPYVESRG